MTTPLSHARRALPALLFAAVSACATPAPLSPDADLSAEIAAPQARASAAERIRADVAWLADDAREGREAGTQGYEAAARYVADRLADLGLEPAGDNGGWFQQVTLRLSRRADGASMTGVRGGETIDFVALEDALINTSPVESVEISGAAVFVGYGVTDPSTDYDDYAGVDATGKIAVMFSGAPKRFDSEKAAHFNGTRSKTENAAAHGAVGLITLSTESSEKRFSWDRVKSVASNPSTTWVHPDGRPESASASIKAGAFMSPAGAKKLFEGAPSSYEALRAVEAAGEAPLKAFDLPIRLTLKGGATYEDVTSPNVVGMIAGTDPTLKHEYVVLSAHLDHIGVRKPDLESKEKNPDLIRNGAMDNAMGVSTLIEAARTFREAGPSKRTIVFLAVTAEEKGLLGAGYFAAYPTVPKQDIVANVNLDMPLVLFDFVDVVAFGAERSTLGDYVAAAAGEMGVALTPDPVPEQGLFTRSDHYRFVEQGVPSVFLVVGFGNGGKEIFDNFLKDHYHQPSDDISLPINYDAAAKFAELNYRIAKALGAAPERPRWNDGDFFGDLFAN